MTTITWEPATGTPEDVYEGHGNDTCEWDGYRCYEDTSHYIEMRQESNSGEEFTFTQKFCARHYAAQLMQFAIFHESNCPIPLAKHYKQYGKIQDRDLR